MDFFGFCLYTPTALLATYLLLISCESIRQVLLVRKSLLANLMAFIAISGKYFPLSFLIYREPSFWSIFEGQLLKFQLEGFGTRVTSIFLTICSRVINNTILVASLGMASIDFAYSSWLIFRVRKHMESWRRWWLNNCQVTLIIPTNNKRKPNLFAKSSETVPTETNPNAAADT